MSFIFHCGDNNNNVSWLVNIHQIEEGMQKLNKNNSRNVIKQEDEKTSSMYFFTSENSL